jgi:hypothetical protein
MKGRRRKLAACLLLASCTPPSRTGSPSPNVVSLPPPPRAVSLLAGGATSPAPAATPDRAQDLAWAQARFPQLRDFVVEVDFHPLLAWVPVGSEVTLYLRAEFTRSNGKEARYDCIAVDATREPPGVGDQDGFGLLIPGPERVVQGQTIRDYLTAGVGAWEVAFGGGGGKQRKRSDGTWESFDGYGTGYRSLGGYVGPVEGDSAYFRYVPVHLAASCGPVVKEACEDGSFRECNTCTTVELKLLDRHELGRTFPPHRRCSVACPVVENADLDRLRRLIGAYPMGYVPYPDNLGVALYKTRVACETDPSWKKPRPHP